MKEATGYPEELLRFILRFDRGEYWLSHEELEELWLREKQDLYKGLIQTAAAFVHIGRGNWRGAASKLEHVSDYLREVEDRRRGLDVAAIRARVAAVADHIGDLRQGRAEEFDETLRFTLEPFFEGDLSGVELEEAELPYRVRRHEEGYRIGRDPHRRD